MSRALFLAAVLLLAPELASACAVCGAAVGGDDSQVAYLITSGVLSVLPLALVGGFLLWVRQRSRLRSREAQPDLVAGAGSAGAEVERSRQPGLTASFRSSPSR